MRLFVLVATTVLLAGCTSPNTSLNRLQFSSDTLPFPDNYQSEAARVVAQRGADASLARVSYPRTTLGTAVTAPQRWYVCVQGVSTAPRPERLPNVEEFVGSLFASDAARDVHNVVLIFGTEGRRPSVREGYDSALCRDVAFEPITAEPPLI